MSTNLKISYKNHQTKSETLSTKFLKIIEKIWTKWKSSQVIPKNIEIFSDKLQKDAKHFQKNLNNIHKISTTSQKLEKNLGKIPKVS